MALHVYPILDRCIQRVLQGDNRQHMLSFQRHIARNKAVSRVILCQLEPDIGKLNPSFGGDFSCAVHSA